MQTGISGNLEAADGERGTLALCSLTQIGYPSDSELLQPRQRYRSVLRGYTCYLSPDPAATLLRRPRPGTTRPPGTLLSVVPRLTRFGLPGARQERCAVRALLLIVSRRTPKQGPHDAWTADVRMSFLGQQSSREDRPSPLAGRGRALLRPLRLRDYAHLWLRVPKAPS